MNLELEADLARHHEPVGSSYWFMMLIHTRDQQEACLTHTKVPLCCSEVEGSLQQGGREGMSEEGRDAFLT